MNNNNGTDIFGLDDNLGGRMNEGWWRIVDGKNSQRYYQMFFECMRKEVVIGGGGIKKGECILGGRGLFIGYREMRRVGDEIYKIYLSNIFCYKYELIVLY